MTIKLYSYKHLICINFDMHDHHSKMKYYRGSIEFWNILKFVSIPEVDIAGRYY